MKKYILLNTIFVVLFMMISAASDAQAGNQQRIQITEFHVEKHQNKVEVNWATDDKTPTNYFEVERSYDGKKFKTVAYVLGADPSKKNCDCYGFSEKMSVSSKETYYRLKHVNINGQVELSEVKSLALK